jgi:hypothetical protein
VEAGTLRMSLDVVKAETEGMGKQHGMIAAQMKNELEDPLATFAGGIKERRKMIQGGIEKLLKTKNAQTMTVNKTRDRFEQDCLKIKGYLAQGHMVMGQEERKNKTKLEKTQAQMSTNSNEYEMAVKVLEETTGRWNREWKAACDKFQDLEEERVDFFKSSLWSFANISSTVCVSDDQSCEKIRLSLEDCDVEKDITNFIADFGTGQEIPDPPKYINFCRGDVDDNVSTAESDDGNYSVAQFQRTMNPTFRSSSPQPSTFESHHDPDSSLREEMGLPKNRAPSMDMFDARASSGSGHVMPINASQTSYSGKGSLGSSGIPPLNPSMSSQHNPYADVPQVPHNPYPADGMTQFCRPPSVRSQRSPIRNGSNCSQEQHSDYTNPTSLSDLEPQSGQQSPTKDYNGSALSQMSQMSNEPIEKPVQKKKSGFFNLRRTKTLVQARPRQRTATAGLLLQSLQLRTLEALRALLPVQSSLHSALRTGRVPGKRNSRHRLPTPSKLIHELPTTSSVLVIMFSTSLHQNRALTHPRLKEMQHSLVKIRSHRLLLNSKASPSKLRFVKVRTDIMACQLLRLLWTLAVHQ